MQSGSALDLCLGPSDYRDGGDGVRELIMGGGVPGFQGAAGGESVMQGMRPQRAQEHRSESINGG